MPFTWRINILKNPLPHTPAIFAPDVNPPQIQVGDYERQVDFGAAHNLIDGKTFDPNVYSQIIQQAIRRHGHLRRRPEQVPAGDPALCGLLHQSGQDHVHRDATGSFHDAQPLRGLHRDLRDPLSHPDSRGSRDDAARAGGQRQAAVHA
jgi:hypothetical protein